MGCSADGSIPFSKLSSEMYQNTMLMPPKALKRCADIP
jgi:hypothetical protein